MHPFHAIRRAFVCLCLAGTAVLPAAHAASVKVEVEGVSGATKSNVMGLLAIAHEQRRNDLSPERIRFLNAQARDQIVEALKPFGYYRAQVHATLRPGDAQWLAVYRIEAGPRIRVHALNIELLGPGRNDATLRKAVREFPLRVGDALDQAIYNKGKEALQQQALARGYLDARLAVHRIRIDLKSYRAQVALRMRTGPRFRFGPVSFSGSVLRTSLLRRYLPFREGEPYSSAKLLELQTALQNSQYFSRVDVTPQKAVARDDAVPIAVKLAPRPRHKYTAGVGYGTDTGARASLGWEDRRVNHLGHKAQVHLRVSRIYRELSARYLIPLAHPATDQLAFSADVLNEIVNGQVSNRRQLGVSRVTTHGTVQQTLSLSYQQELFSVGLTSGRSRLLIPGVSWTRIDADNRIYTTRGSRLALRLQGAARGVLSNTSFAQADLQAKVIRSFGSGNRLIVRGEAGATYASDFSRLPVSLRFFAGGDNSVRGYAYRSLGPTDASGAVIGGRYLLVGSVEYDRRIVGNWGAAVFYDAGNAFNSRAAALKRGAGFGLRWRSPVGMVRVDLASALSEPGHPLRLHISIGPDL